MRKPLVALSLFGLLLFSACDSGGSERRAAPDTFFHAVRTEDYAAQFSTWGRAVTAVPGGGYLLAGTAETGERGRDAWVARIDARGEVVWTKTYGSARDEEIYELARAAGEADVVLAGTAQKNQVYLLRIGAEGEERWERKYNRRTSGPLCQREDEGFAVTALSGGEFAVGGRTLIPTPGDLCAGSVLAPSVLRVDGSGDALWFKDYHDEVGIGHLLAIAPGRRGGALTSGIYSGPPPFEVAADGSFAGRTASSVAPDAVYDALKRAEDGAYFAAGSAFNGDRIEVAKLAAESGELAWSKTLARGMVHDLVPARGGGVVAAGMLKEEGRRVPYLLKLDGEGEIVWRALPEGGGEFFGVARAKGGGFIATGRRRSSRGGEAFYEPIVLRTDAEGHFKTGGF